MRLRERTLGQRTEQVEVRRKRPLTLKEQRAALVKRVMDEYLRTGIVPRSLINKIADVQHATHRANRDIVTRETVRDNVEQWAVEMCQRWDRKRGVNRKDP